jgi:hypothetical protein
MSNTKFDFEEAERVYKLIISVGDKAKDNIRDLRKQHIDWHPDTDIRISGFCKLSNVHGATALGIKYYANYLIDPKWWADNSSGYSGEDINRMNRSFTDMQKFGFIQAGFSTMESTLRELLRSVDPIACNRSTDAFKNVYECLIRTKLTDIDKTSCDLLDLMKCIRNTNHNNGVYFSKRNNESISYAGTKYDFVHGKKVDFITWDLICNLHEDARNLLKKIVDHPLISSLPGTIVDPYA